MMHRRTLLGALFALGCAVLSPMAASATAFTSTRITIKTEGSGSDVILIPGLKSSPRVWDELVKSDPKHRYHLVQIAGFAGLPKDGNNDGPVSAPVAEELARYISEQGLKNTVVIGHSMGGSIGLMLAARHPQAVSKLMVVDMVPFLGALFGPPGTTPQSIKPMADGLMARMRTPDPAARQQKAEAMIGAMIETVAKRASAVDDMLRSDDDVAARAYYELVVTDLAPELAKVRAKTTVLYVLPKGMPLTEEQMDGKYKSSYATLAGANLKRIPDSAHFIMLDQPERFRTEVQAFLQ
ncbi:MAG: alpha/beta hydrolase [Pseudomonadota bacterium]